MKITVLRFIGAAGLGLLPSFLSAQQLSPQPGPQADRSSPPGLVVWCYDASRDIAYRELASQCHGSIISDSAAQAARERRDREITKALAVPLAAASEGRIAAYGTAFFVDGEGHLVTNNHVVEGCNDVVVEADHDKTFPVSVVAVDVNHDLALLHAAIKPVVIARFRSQVLDQVGAFVAAIGYPDLGLPAREPVVTNGVILQLAPDETRENIALEADIRGGNSGSPIVDTSGLVVGVIRARLDAVKAYSKTGVVPPDIGFGVSLPVVLEFFKKNDVHYLDGREGEILDSAELLEAARPYMARVECWK